MYELTISNIISHLPTAFVFGTILLNNIVFGYILMSDCFLKPDELNDLEKYQ
jgi:hypothetical protein